MNKEAIGTLTGKFFHSVGSDLETIKWQGMFLGLASPGLYRVRIFDKFVRLVNPAGDVQNTITVVEPSEQRLVPATDMRYWKIYDTTQQLLDAWDRYAKYQDVKFGWRYPLREEVDISPAAKGVEVAK
jgi:hypothetical protein